MSDPIVRLNAVLEGRYAIEREGGMATVYLAEDIKHNRNVALKVRAWKGGQLSRVCSPRRCSAQ